jgi:hypothetical protein
MGEVGDEGGGTSAVTWTEEEIEVRLSFLEELRADLDRLKAEFAEMMAHDRAVRAELERQAELEAVFRPRWFWRLWARLGLP